MAITAETPMQIDQNELERLSKAATQGEWEFRKIGHDHFQAHNAIEHEVLSTPRSTNAAFIVALVNAYRAGQLVPVQQPSGDVVEAVARAIMVVNGACLVKDWAIERRDNPHVALAWDQATAAITALDAVRVKQ